MCATYELADETALAALAAEVAAQARAGDLIALRGPLGVGKTTFARAFIRALGCDEEVPSPTFTLVQSYELAPCPVWHYDLYRLEQAEELWELGIEDALAEGIVLMEWPERAEALLPDARIDIDMSFAETGRRLTLWRRQARAAQIASFLEANGWGAAQRAPLAGDASFRRYERLHRDGEAAVLMDAPPPEDVTPFVDVARHLREVGYSAPSVMAVDGGPGLALLEDLGDDTYSRVLDSGANPAPLYAAAVDLLADLHRHSPPTWLAPYDEAAYLTETDLLLDWFMPAMDAAPDEAAREAFHDAWRAVLPRAALGAPVTVLRDYHADNLMWLPARRGHARVGLLDFQDALAGSPAYDLVSLLEDARRDVSGDLAEAMIRRYLAAAPALDADAFRAAYAILGGQRNTKIIGIFTRLWQRDGKPAYLAMMPHVWRLLEGDLGHPALSDVRAWFDRHLPGPLRRAPQP